MLFFLEVIYHVNAENVAVIGRRTIFDDTMFRKLENNSLESDAKYSCWVHAKHRQYALMKLTMAADRFFVEKTQCAVKLLK